MGVLTPAAIASGVLLPQMLLPQLLPFLLCESALFFSG
jgi:hypothetical protein